MYTIHSIAILHEVQQLDNVSDRLDTLAESNILSSQEHSSPSREAFVIPPLCRR